MPKQRKTIEVSQVRELANNMLANSRDDKRDQRFGVASMLEQVLISTGNYRGFSYLDGYDAVRDDRHDESRRHYS